MNVLIQSRVHKSDNGRNRVEKSPTVERVVRKYANGNVEVSSGDVWKVVPSKGKHKGVPYQMKAVL